MTASLQTTEAPAWLADETSLGTGGDGHGSRLFGEHLQADFRSAARTGRPCSLLVLEPHGDCDCFLDVLVGLALVEAGEGAGAYALGRGRFALLLPETELEEALALGRRLELRLAFLCEGRTDVSIGAAVTGTDTASAEVLFARADLAMLEARTSRSGAPVAFGCATATPPSKLAAPGRLLVELGYAGRRFASRPTDKPASERLAGAVGDELADRLLENCSAEA